MSAQRTNTTSDGEDVYLSDPYYANRQDQAMASPYPNGQPIQANAYPNGYPNQQPAAISTHPAHPYTDPRAPKGPPVVYSPVSLHQYAMFPATTRPLAPAPSASPFDHNQQALNIHTSYTSTPHQPISHASPNPGTPTGAPTSDPDTITKDKKHACNLCGSAFERRYDLKRHMHTHAEHKEFICPGCQKALARNDSLQRHQTVCKARSDSS